MNDPLPGKRVLVTQATEFMGPVLCKVFREQGATVLCSDVDLSEPDAAEAVVRDAGSFDVLVANLSVGWSEHEIICCICTPRCWRRTEN